MTALKLNTDSMHKIHVFSSADSEKKLEPITAYLPLNITMSVASDWGSPFESGDATKSALGRLAAVIGASFKMQALSAQVWQGTSPIEFNLPLILYAETDPYKDVILPAKRLMQLALPNQNEAGFMVPPGPNFAKYLHEHGDATKALRYAQRVTAQTGASVASDDSIAGDVGGAIISGGAWVIGKTAEYAKALIAILAEYAGEQERIDIAIGHLLHLKSIVVKSVTCSFSMQNLHHSGLPMRCDAEVQVRTYTSLLKADLDDYYNLGEIFQEKERYDNPESRGLR